MWFHGAWYLSLLYITYIYTYININIIISQCSPWFRFTVYSGVIFRSRALLSFTAVQLGFFQTASELSCGPDALIPWAPWSSLISEESGRSYWYARWFCRFIFPALPLFSASFPYRFWRGHYLFLFVVDVGIERKSSIVSVSFLRSFCRVETGAP